MANTQLLLKVSGSFVEQRAARTHSRQSEHPFSGSSRGNERSTTVEFAFEPKVIAVATSDPATFFCLF
jgi:hypothetical protein